jgi:hypothetical protein
MASQSLGKAKLVSAHELSRVVDEAVKAASLRTDPGGGTHNVILRPDILGRLIRDAGQAQHFAEAVAKGVTKAGVHAEPVVISIGDGTRIAGFIEREALQLREIG